MYRTIQNNPQIESIWVVSYDGLKPCDEHKRRCEECFPDILDDNTMIIYTPSDDGIIVLGYYKLDEVNITQSTMYEQLRMNTLIINEIDLTDELKQKKCMCILSWVLDKSLRSKKYLTTICESIVENTRKQGDLLWCEGRNEIIFYPLSERYAAIEYFANAFMNE